MMKMLPDLVTLVKPDGKKYENISARIQFEKIFIGGSSKSALPVEEGDTLIRKLPNGLIEEYIVIDRGYMPAGGIVFQSKVKRKTTLSAADEKSGIIVKGDIKADQVYIGNKGIQTQYKTAIEGVTPQQFFAEIREFIEESELSDEVKNALVKDAKDLESDSESGNLSRVEVAYRTENIVKQIPSLIEKFGNFVSGVGSSLVAAGIWKHGDKIIAGIKFALGLS